MTTSASTHQPKDLKRRGPAAEQATRHVHPSASSSSFQSARRKRNRSSASSAILPAALNAVLFATTVWLLLRHSESLDRYLPSPVRGWVTSAREHVFGFSAWGEWQSPTAQGHYPFDDGRKTTAPESFLSPKSDALYWVNVMLGNGGPEPDLSGGMIPSVAPPFAMTRWTPQTRQNYVSMCPYNQTDTKIHGFIGTHQPAVWMGESGPVQVAAGLGPVVVDFEQRGLDFSREDEYASANYYSNVLQAKGGTIDAELSASSRVGHLRFTFHPRTDAIPHVILDAARPSIVTNKPDNVTYPPGSVTVDLERNEIYGWNTERQDHILVGEELPAKNFKGYFVARFSAPLTDGGISKAGRLSPERSGEGSVLSAWATLPSDTTVVDVRVGVSFISVEQARRNIDLEIPDGQSLETTSFNTRQLLADKLGALKVEGATPRNLTVLYTAAAHALVYPYEVSENAGSATTPKWHYYSGYLDKVVDGISYSGYSIWDTFRATTAWQLLAAPERVPSMINSMLQDYVQGGWLPMWKNIVETNIMVGTHADSIIAQALLAGVTGFDRQLAWAAVKKDAFTPPDRDTELTFFDREEHTPQEVRAGLTEYMKLGYVAADLHSESGSRSLDYAYDDYAAAIVARVVGATDDAEVLEARAKNYRHLWNKETGFMEAKFSNGSWAGETTGWTEGDHWAYSLNVMHDVPGLIELMGGNKEFVDFLDRHFAGGHNLHTNEPSHHIPYLYGYAGAAHKAQEWVRTIGENEYNHTDIGLSGNEDCGQMSAWYLFSALGLYPVDPAGAKYVIGAPFFEYAELTIPASPWNPPKPTWRGWSSANPKLIVRAPGATRNKYVKSLSVNGAAWHSIEIPHELIAAGAELDFEMSDVPQPWPQPLHQ